MTLLYRAFFFMGIFLLISFLQNGCSRRVPIQTKKSKRTPNPTINKLYNNVLHVAQYVEQHTQYNNRIAFLIDMSLPSGRNRFYIYDMQQDSILGKGLVAHGSGSEKRVNGKLNFSNTINSLCTSLGKYAIGNSYNGDFGKAYKLHGLDSTNSNAALRDIVLHKYDTLPYNEQEDDICLSYGCPMVNPDFFKRLEQIIDNSEKPILLQIFY